MFFMVLASLCLTRAGHAQNINTLEVGDRLPDLTFTNVINAPYSSIPYAELKDKVVVLDFFATWCSSCLNLFPHLDSLQTKFGNQLAIFVVTKEPREKVENMLKTKAIAKGLKLPFIVEDSLLNGLFPNKYLPHEVLLKDNKVVGITYPDFLNKGEIAKLVNGEKLNLPIKKDRLHYDYDQSLIKNLASASVNIALGQFFLSKAIEGVPSMAYVRKSKDKEFIQFTKINRTLLELLEKSAGFLNEDNRIILEVNDSTKFITDNPLDYKWRLLNTYCMEYIVPSKWSENQVGIWLLDQFSKFLNYDIFIEERFVDCWVLTKLENNKKDPSEKNKNQLFIYKKLNDMVRSMNNQIFGKPIVPIVLNETNDTSAVNIKLKKSDIHNPRALSKALQYYGYTLKPAMRKLKMLIIKDKRLFD